MKLTLEDIGKMAGVSRSTVSRVINDQENVSPAARQRVEEVIARTGFVPNVAARSLASNRTGIIGIVVPSRVHNLFGDPYFGILIQGMSRASNLAGVTLSLFIFQSLEEEEELYPRIVGAGLVDGILLTASRMGDPLQTRLIDGAIPFVMVGRPDRPDRVSYVDVDNTGGSQHAAEFLCGLGYERIGYIGAPLTTTTGIDRLEGFREGLARRGGALRSELRRDGDFSERSGYNAMCAILPAKPDAVFVASDTMAVGALLALRDQGMRAPDDVAVVSFDDLPIAESTRPPLTTVRQPIAATGARAVDLLLGLVSGSVSGPVANVLPTELVIRDSAGSAPGSAVTGVSAAADQP